MTYYDPATQTFTTPIPAPLNCDASSLGLPPGRWPARINFAGTIYLRGDIVKDVENDIRFVRYAGPKGHRRPEILVFND